MQTVLLIEDEASIADMVLYALKSEGFDTAWCSLGRDGIQRLLDHPEIALLILDIGLPDGSGFEFCKDIRRFSDIPIIFLTARNEEVDRIVGLEIGGDDYMGKPFSPRELTARVKAILKRSRGHDGTGQVPQTTFEIDTARRQIRYGSSWLDLTRYEFEVLRTLLRQPGRIYSREEIMERVWPESAESLERAVDTHIKTLRSKLRRVSEEESPIKTHRGQGYSITGSIREI